MAIVILPGPKLSERTTLGLGGFTLAELSVHAVTDLDELPEKLAQIGGKPLILGEGSNICARDGNLQVAVVSLNLDDKLGIVSEGEKSVELRVSGDYRLPRLQAFLQKAGLTGLEPLMGIPGSVGGAVAMNAGSYGADIGKFLRRVVIWSPLTGLKELQQGEWQAEYREFKPLIPTGNFFIVAEAVLEFRKDSSEAVRRRCSQVYTRKKAGQPVLEASAGCVFKNPSPESPAGLLLDKAGMRGFAIGGMCFSEMHANFMINKGEGTSDQAFELIDIARERVKNVFSVELELEIRICP